MNLSIEFGGFYADIKVEYQKIEQFDDNGMVKGYEYQIDQCWLIDDDGEESKDIACWVNNMGDAFESIVKEIKAEEANF